MTIKTPTKLVPQSKRWQIIPQSWRFLLIIVLIIGIAFRFANLDRKVFWLDEIKAVYKISGYEYAEYQQKFNGQIISPQDFQKFGDPKSESTIGDVVSILTKEDAKHVPLYFIILRSWVDLFGNSITAIRSLSAIFGVLTIPCMYWLCVELFDSLLAGLLGAALISISPFFVLYAQEARPYSLWTVTILGTSWLLLRAMRQPSTFNWGAYTLGLILSIYTHTLSVLVVLSHGIYLVCTQGLRLSKVLINYLTAILIGSITFWFWFRYILINQEKLVDSVEWHDITISFSSLVNWWIVNLSRIFCDFNATYNVKTDFNSFYNFFSIFTITSLFISIVYSIYYLIIYSNPNIKWSILTIITIPALALAIPDILSGGIRSTASRYLVPSYIGICLSVTYLLSSKISSQSHKLWWQKSWIFITILLIISGILSCSFISPQITWWNKYMSSELPQIAKVIDRVDSPLVIIDSHGWSQDNGLSLSYFLDSKVKLQLLSEPKLLEIPQDFQDIFLFAPSEALLNKTREKQEFQLEQISPMLFTSNSLFKVYQ